MSKILDLVLAGTPPQFDNDASLATTEFVRKNGLLPSALQEYGTNTTLTAADAGKIIRVTGAVTFTLPAASSVPAGTMFWFINGNAGTSYTVQRAGSDIIQTGVDLTSLTAMGGDTLVLVKTGSASWGLADGSTVNKYSAGFAASVARPGYQKLPSGIIVQWGTTPASSSSAGVATSFPLAFPNTCWTVSIQVSASSNGFMASVETLSSTGFTSSMYSNNTTRAAGVTAYYIAIGY